jgi:gluconate 5-dehydrogenase
MGEKHMNMFDLTGKIALVTGGAHSIGFAIGKALAQAGAKVCFNCTNEGSRKRGLENYAAEGIEAHGYVADVTSEEQMNALVAQIKEEHGIIDILVNNAGIIKRIPMLEMSVEDFKQVVDVDLNAPFICAKAVLPGMLERKTGSIVNVASVAGVYGNANMACYSATKGALIAFTQALAKEVATHGVRVNALSPGTVSSSAVEDITFTEPNQLSYMGRTGSDLENANTICFLASDDVPYLSGQNLQVDGVRKQI